MSGDQPPREDSPADTEPAPTGRRLRLVPPLEDEADEAEGGDPVCWAHLVCDECGAIASEGHRTGCSKV
jgi:hypothetical protein